MIDVLLADFSYETKVYNHTIERQQERYKRIKDIENKIVAFLIETYHLQPAACYSQRHPHYKTPNKELVFLKSTRDYDINHWREKIAFLEEQNHA